MLQIKPVCENCGKKLPYNSTEAMVCSFECTFCSDCVTTVLSNVCPNCGGGLEKRPVRPSDMLSKYPATTTAFIKKVDPDSFAPLLNKFKNLKPEKR